jgi:uridine phosphorylase
MEAAALFAVAKFRKVVLRQILYGGDDVSGTSEWDPRGWYQRHEIRERLFWLSVQACLEIS